MSIKKVRLPMFEAFSENPDKYLKPINEDDVQDNTEESQEVLGDENAQDAGPDADLKDHVPTFDEWEAENGLVQGPVEKMDTEDDTLGAQLDDDAQLSDENSDETIQDEETSDELPDTSQEETIQDTDEMTLEEE